MNTPQAPAPPWFEYLFFFLWIAGTVLYWWYLWDLSKRKYKSIWEVFWAQFWWGRVGLWKYEDLPDAPPLRKPRDVQPRCIKCDLPIRDDQLSLEDPEGGGPYHAKCPTWRRKHQKG